MNDEETKATDIKAPAVIDATERDSSITMPEREYGELRYWADMGQRRTSFWDEALENPEGTTALKDGIKDVVDST